jgi:quercetin dioxygenase-like cupin family protein
VSAFDEVASIQPQQLWAGVLGRVVDGERVTFAVIELDPDTTVPEHRHENEQLGVLVRGSMRFRIGDETRDLEPGGTWCIAANVPHEVHTGPHGAIAVEVFAPVREDWRRVDPLEPSSPLWPDF